MTGLDSAVGGERCFVGPCTSRWVESQGNEDRSNDNFTWRLQHYCPSGDYDCDGHPGELEQEEPHAENAVVCLHYDTKLTVANHRSCAIYPPRFDAIPIKKRRQTRFTNEKNEIKCLHLLMPVPRAHLIAKHTCAAISDTAAHVASIIYNVPTSMP